MSGRVVAIDFGSKRIGVAVSDATGVLASPLTVLERSGSVENDHRRIAKLVGEEEAELVVVGLPVDLKGKKSVAAENVLAEVAQLATVLDVPVTTFDERMTTATASRRLSEMGVSQKKQRASIDKYAAAVILQSFLDGRNSA